MQSPDPKREKDGASEGRASDAKNIAGKKVLILEDSSETAEMTRVFLEGAGLDVRVAETIKEARAQIQEKLPDVLLLDIHVPDGDGLDFLAEVRKFHSEIPAVIFTSEGYNEEKMEIALKAGASGFVSKYMGPSTVLVALRNAMNNRGSQTGP